MLVVSVVVYSLVELLWLDDELVLVLLEELVLLLDELVSVSARF